MYRRETSYIYVLGAKPLDEPLTNTGDTLQRYYIEDPKEASRIDYIYIEEDTKVEETTIADIITTTYPIRSDTISIINLDAS